MRVMTSVITCMVLIALIQSLVISPVSADDQAPNVSLVDVDDIPFNLTDYQEEGTVLVLHFMFLTCEPCKVMDRDLKDMYDGDDRGYEILSIDLAIPLDSSEALKAYAEDNGYDWRFSMDNEDGDALDRFEILAYPTIVIIDSEGNVSWSKHSFIEIEVLSDAIDIAINEPPVAKITISTTDPTAGEPVHLSGASSGDPDGDVLSYHWDLGDGSYDDLMEGNHTYTEEGSYAIVLTVTDGNLEHTTQLVIEVAPADDDDGSLGLGNLGSIGGVILALILLVMMVMLLLAWRGRRDQD